MRRCRCPRSSASPMGDALAITCKTSGTLVFHDAASLERLSTVPMPGLTHELAASPCGRLAWASVYGDGIFGSIRAPDRRIARIDLAARRLDGTFDAGCRAPHGLMRGADGLLWVTAELDRGVVALEPQSGEVVARIDCAGSPHWLVLSNRHRRLFASCKGTERLVVVDLVRRRVEGAVAIPGLCEGLALDPRGETLFVCAHESPVLHEFDAGTLALRRSVTIAGTPDRGGQLRRICVSPDGATLAVASHRDDTVAVLDRATLRQRALVAVGRAPMALAFLPQAGRAVLCEHDDATLAVLDLHVGQVVARAGTDAGCEFALLH